MSATIVYLDICALKRPFDDATNDRIRREAEAVARIFEKVENGSIDLVVSPAHRFENDRNPRSAFCSQRAVARRRSSREENQP